MLSQPDKDQWILEDCLRNLGGQGVRPLPAHMETTSDASHPLYDNAIGQRDPLFLQLRERQCADRNEPVLCRNKEHDLCERSVPRFQLTAPVHEATGGQPGEIVAVPLVKERPAPPTLGFEETQPGDQFQKMIR